MRIRSVLQEFEAKLAPAQPGASASARGKAEWKVYGDGTRGCKVSISGLDLPDGAVLQLAVSGRPIDQLVVSEGKARYKRQSERGEVVPQVELNQVLQVSYAGQIILKGELYPE